jgi:hypothetical protein
MSEGGGISPAVKELIVIVLLFFGVGFLWLATGGIQQVEKSIKDPTKTVTATTTSNGSFWDFFKPVNFNFDSNNSNTNDNSGYGIDDWYKDANTTTQNETKPATPAQDVTYNSYQKDLIYYGSQNPVGPILDTPDKINIDGVYPGYNSSTEEVNEYLIISASTENKKKFLISGLTLKSRMTGLQAQIGEGATVYYSNTINAKNPIFLAPGESAYIITGRSPLGYSFKVNKCMGYLAQYQNFYPNIEIRCPLLSDYPYPEKPNAFSDQCLDFLDGFGSCRTVSNEDFPEDLPQNCKNFAIERANYTRCLTDFGNEKDFLSNDWRIYLGRSENLWKDRREIIDVVDSKGNIIQTYTY